MAAPADTVYHTSGFIRLTRPHLVGTLGGLLLALLVAALDQTVVGTAEPRIIASLSPRKCGTATPSSEGNASVPFSSFRRSSA